MGVRAVRGATQVAVDETDEVLRATRESLHAVLEGRQLVADDLISAVFTASPDLRSEFLGAAARQRGGTDLPRLRMYGIDVPDAMPRVLKLLGPVESEPARPEVARPELRCAHPTGAADLRADLAK